MAPLQYKKGSEESLEYPENGVWSPPRKCNPRFLCVRLADNRRRLIAASTFLFLACGAATTHAAFVFLCEILYNNGTRMYTEKILLGLAVASVCTAGTAMYISVRACFASYRRKPESIRHLVLVCRILVLIEVSVAVLGLSYQTRVKSDAKNLADWRGFVYLYHKNANLRSDMDSIQTKFRCCGFTSYEDWEVNSYFACSSKSAERCGVPASCCKGNSPSRNCSYRIRSHSTKEKHRSKIINTRGCLELVIAWTKYNLIIISVACLFVVCSQVMLFSVTDGLLNEQAYSLEETLNENVELNLDNVELLGADETGPRK